jgi:hypothetical protein
VGASDDVNGLVRALSVTARWDDSIRSGIQREGETFPVPEGRARDLSSVLRVHDNRSTFSMT